jgi:hypothetical protein
VPTSIAGVVQPLAEMAKPVLEAPQKLAQSVGQAIKPIGQATAAGINQWNPTGKEFDLGRTEWLEGDTQKANQVLGSTIERAGQKFNIPEMEVSEAAKQGGLTGALRQLGGNVVDTISTPFKKLGMPDFGVSEAIAQGKTINTGANFLPANAMEGENYSKAPKREDYANVLNQNLQNVGQQLQAKAGQGINLLKSAGSGISNLINNGLEKITPKRVVGDESGSVAEEVGETSQMVSAQPKNDIRDPFFKQGGAQVYSKYLAPNAEQKKGGALTLDLFSPDFFQNADNIANVFGSTSMGKEATDKYKAYEKSKYPLTSFSPMSYQEGYDRGEVDRYNQANQQQVSNYNQSISIYLGSIPSVLTSSFSFKDTPKPTNERLSFGSITRTESIAPKASYSANPAPQMSFARNKSSIGSPQMSFARSINAPTAKLSALSVIPVPRYTPPQPKKQPTLEEYLSKGKTAAQYHLRHSDHWKETSDVDSTNSTDYTG